MSEEVKAQLTKEKKKLDDLNGKLTELEEEKTLREELKTLLEKDDYKKYAHLYEVSDMDKDALEKAKAVVKASSKVTVEKAETDENGVLTAKDTDLTGVSIGDTVEVQKDKKVIGEAGKATEKNKANIRLTESGDYIIVIKDDQNNIKALFQFTIED